MKRSKYQKELGSTAAFTKIMMEATKGVCQKYRKGATNDCFLFDSWFSSKKAEESYMGVGFELIVMVKKNTKGFCKETIENLTKDWYGGYYLVLRSKPMVTRGRPLISIGYKYNAWKGICFIVTYTVGITQTGPPYLSKHPIQFTNVAICPVACHLLCQKNLLLMRLTPTKN